MLTAEQEDKIRSSIKGMRGIINCTTDAKERFYYYGQVDGILGLLEILGIEIDLKEGDKHGREA